MINPYFFAYNPVSKDKMTNTSMQIKYLLKNN